MAKFLSRSSKLRADYVRYRRLSILGFVIGMVSFSATILYLVILSADNVFSFVGLLGIVGFLIGFVLYGKMKNKESILRSGIEGENAASDMLALLDDSYICIQNLVIEVDNNKSELDNVVIGNNGVFVIETKNMRGLIQGSNEDLQWTKTKISRQNTETFVKSFYSPIKQVSTQVYRLAEYLKRNGIRVYIQGIVYFSNRESEIEITGKCGKIPVFSVSDDGKSGLVEYISSYSKSSLSNEQKHAAASLLIKPE